MSEKQWNRQMGAEQYEDGCQYNMYQQNFDDQESGQLTDQHLKQIQLNREM